ncbi:MAG: RNA methyltransferase [Acidimicrobiaceae bacterium]|nr:RNA methyltransferase [Acidimicrobiaceae bacterium]
MDELIRSVSNPVIKSIRKLSENRSERRRTGRFLIEGYKVCIEALRRPGLVELVLLSDEANEMEGALLADATAQAGVELRWVTGSVLRSVSDSQSPQGVTAKCIVPPQFSFAPDSKGPIFWLDQLQDPGNVGAVIRVASAMGHVGVLVSQGSADPFSPKATRASAGQNLVVPILTEFDPQAVAMRCRESGGRVLIADSAGGIPIWEAGGLGNCLVVLGSEGAGPSAEVRALADRTVLIPMDGGVESLNVAVSAGIIAYEAYRSAQIG